MAIASRKRARMASRSALHVEASLGQFGQRQTHDEGLAPMAQKAEAGEARMLVGRRAEELAQPGRCGSSNAVDTVADSRTGGGWRSR
jgi:hypothetical protein